MTNLAGCFFSLLTLFVLGCQSPERPQIVKISAPAVTRPTSPKQVDTPEMAVATVITVCRDDLGLPVVDPLSVHLYKNSASLAQHAFARKLYPADVQSLTAFSQFNEIHVNTDQTGGAPWGALVSLLAHEYGHNIHSSLNTNFSRFPVWITEGFATWLAARTLHSLGWQDYEISLRVAKREVNRIRNDLPDLMALRDGNSWTELTNKPNGWARTYSLAFVAMDRLIGTTSLGALVNYLKSEDFEGSFRIGSASFVADFRKFLTSIVPKETEAFSAQKPEWKTGYEWVYEDRYPGKVKTTKKQVIREDAFIETPVFVVRDAEEEYFYNKKTFGLVATKKNNKFTSKRDRPNEFFSWPLETAKEWRNTFVLENLEDNRFTRIDRTMFISQIEQVQLPAGTFTAVKIDAYENRSGRLHAEYWYSPKVKWFVKSIVQHVGDGYAREQRLKSFYAGGE